MLLVLGGEFYICGRDGPFYPYLRVVPRNGSFGFGMVEVVALVLEDCRLAEDGKAVGETFGHEELAVVVFGEFTAYVFAVGGTSFAYIYCHIEDSATHATDQFALGVGRQLKVESAKHTIVAAGFVVLHKVDVQSCLLFELLGVEALKEVSAAIAEDTRLDNQNTIYFCPDYFHIKKYILQLFHGNWTDHPYRKPETL